MSRKLLRYALKVTAYALAFFAAFLVLKYFLPSPWLSLTFLVAAFLALIGQKLIRGKKSKSMPHHEEELIFKKKGWPLTTHPAVKKPAFYSILAMTLVTVLLVDLVNKNFYVYYLFLAYPAHLIARRYLMLHCNEYTDFKQKSEDTSWIIVILLAGLIRIIDILENFSS